MSIDIGQRRTSRGRRGGAATRFEREFDPELSVDGALALRSEPRPDSPSELADEREETAPAKRRLTVAPPAPVSVPRTTFVLFVILAVIGGVLGILVINTKINENQFKLSRLHDQQAGLDETQSRLEREIAALESPNSLAAAAKLLGLVPATDPAYIRLPDGRKFLVAGPAKGKPSGAAGGAEVTASQPTN
jgi:hypothetical protein